MAKFVYLNVEPGKIKKNDCVTRAIKLVSGLSYSTIRKKLFHTKKLIDCESAYCPTCYSFLIQEVLGGVSKNCDNMTVEEFANKHPNGNYLVRIEGHLTAICNSVIFDIWDCRSRYCSLAWRVD